MSSIIFIAQFPPPIHGLSKAVETLYNSRLKEKYYFKKIDITDNRRFLVNLWLLFWMKSDLFYFTISQSKGGNWRDLLILQILQWKKAKILIHLHGGNYRNLIENDCGKIQRLFNKKSMRKVDGAIVLGDSLRWIFDGVVSKNKVFVVKNCIDNQFCCTDINNKLSNIFSDQKLHVLFLSNFIASKGYPELLQVAKMLKERGYCERFEFHFAGKFFEYSEENYFKAFVEDNSLNAMVTLHGPTYGDVKKELLRKCHVFSLLTTYPNEGQPISILEAMGNGMAIITTNHAGIVDIATKENGFVCSRTNVEISAIADWLERMYDERETLAKICERNYYWVHSEFTEENYICNMECVFDDLICKIRYDK